MRHYILFYVNGEKQKIDKEDSFKKLSDYLRYDLFLTGTKVVCSEGDCGACSILYGKYIPQKEKLQYSVINSCIKYLYQLDQSHIITVEGLSKNDELNVVQETLANNHGTQCGFCTPGFAVTITDIFVKNQNNKHFDLSDSSRTFQFLKENLSGNLCRCTGYDPILQASMYLLENKTKTLATSYSELFDENTIIDDFKGLSNEIKIELENYTYYQSDEVKKTLEYIEKEHPDRIVSGGTDISVQIYKTKKEITHLLSNHFVSDFNYMYEKDKTIFIGANVSITEFMTFISSKVFIKEQHLQEIFEYLKLFASPQIRNIATMAGNIANASPIGDLLPMLYVLDAKIEIVYLDEEKVKTKLIPINEFYTGYKQMQLNTNELIKGIEFDIPHQKILKLYKVSKRKHLDIATFNAAFLLKIEKNNLADVSIAFGGVAPVILRMSQTEKFLLNKEFSLDSFEEAKEIAEKEVTPISDVRASKKYRRLLAGKVLLKLYHEVKEGVSNE